MVCADHSKKLGAEVGKVIIVTHHIFLCLFCMIYGVRMLTSCHRSDHTDDYDH